MNIYKIINLINNKIYIGQSKNNDENYFGSGVLIAKAINKYGKENFKKEILQECGTKEELCIFEKYWIKKLNSQTPNGYNIHEGGNGGDMFLNNPNLENIKKKMRKPKATKNFQVGENNSFYNKHHSNETKNKISVSVSITLNKPEVKKKFTGKRHGRYGTNLYNIWLETYGKKIADGKYKLLRKKISDSKTKNIKIIKKCLYCDGDMEVFSWRKFCSRSCSNSFSNVKRGLKHKEEKESDVQSSNKGFEIIRT